MPVRVTYDPGYCLRNEILFGIGERYHCNLDADKGLLEAEMQRIILREIKDAFWAGVEFGSRHPEVTREEMDPEESS